jgi:hypothetical protein
MPTNEELIVTKTVVELHDASITSLILRMNQLEQRVAAAEALLNAREDKFLTILDKVVTISAVPVTVPVV